MKFIKTTILTKKRELNKLYATNAIAIEGLVKSDIHYFVEWIQNECECKFANDEIEINIIKGKAMNENYGLTGNNAYQDELTIVAIPLNQIDVHNIGKLALKRFDIGARWFDDIVDNNLRREGKGE